MEQLPVYNMKLNKKHIILTLALVLLSVSFIYFSFSSLLERRVSELETRLTPITTTVFKETVVTYPSTATTYTVKEFDGKIGVFLNGDFQYVIDTYVFTLPEQDKKLLQKGINASSLQELDDILSCYY